jgi:hypothetical protein
VRSKGGKDDSSSHQIVRGYMMSSVAQASNGPAFFAVLVELQCNIAVIAIKDKKTI